LKDHGRDVIKPALNDDDFAAAVSTAQAEFDQHQPEVVVGSSRGGAIAMNVNSGDARLVLLCPAWKNWGTATTVKSDTVILHSRADDVIPFADSEELVRNSELPAWTLIEIGNDHRLADPESLKLMLAACLMDDDELLASEEDILERDWTGLCYTAVLRWASTVEDNWRSSTEPSGAKESGSGPISPLSSADSPAVGFPALFARFSGTMRLSDFPETCTSAVWHRTFSDRSTSEEVEVPGISQLPRGMFPTVRVVSDSVGVTSDSP